MPPPPKSFLRGISSARPLTLSFSILTPPAGDDPRRSKLAAQKDEHEFRIAQVLETRYCSENINNNELQADEEHRQDQAMFRKPHQRQAKTS